jgi:hypothetical protein
MPKATFFNKGLLKGTLSKSEIVKFEGKGGKKGGSFLSLEVATGNGNKIKGTIFPTKSNPQKHTELHATYPVNSKVEVSGRIQEQEFESKSGKKGIDRSVGATSIKTLTDEKQGATFILQGIVEKVKETSDGILVTVRYDETYENDKKEEITRSEEYNLVVEDEDLISDNDVVKGCNAKFKGRILNSLEYDEYGDITGSIQAFKVEKVENVISPDDLVTEEEPEIEI